MSVTTLNTVIVKKISKNLNYVYFKIFNNLRTSKFFLIIYIINYSKILDKHPKKAHLSNGTQDLMKKNFLFGEIWHVIVGKHRQVKRNGWFSTIANY